MAMGNGIQLRACQKNPNAREEREGERKKAKEKKKQILSIGDPACSSAGSFTISPFNPRLTKEKSGKAFEIWGKSDHETCTQKKFDTWKGAKGDGATGAFSSLYLSLLYSRQLRDVHDPVIRLVGDQKMAIVGWMDGRRKRGRRRLEGDSDAVVGGAPQAAPSSCPPTGPGP